MQTKLISKSIIALTAFTFIGAGALSPAWSQTKSRTHMRAAPQAQQQTTVDAYNQYDGRAWSNAQASTTLNLMQSNRCIADEGYGRVSYCDGSN